jgi:hypothetical protein
MLKHQRKHLLLRLNASAPIVGKVSQATSGRETMEGLHATSEPPTPSGLPKEGGLLVDHALPKE